MRSQKTLYKLKKILWLTLVLSLSIPLVACGPRYKRVTAHKAPGVIVKLRSQTGVDRGFSHPATISGARLAHILSFIDIRGEKGARKPAFPVAGIYEVGEALSRVFANAEPHQVLTVELVRVEKRFQLFNQKFLTTFVTYVEGDRLFLRLSRVDWEIPKGEDEDDLPEPFVGRKQQSFRILPAEYLTAIGVQGVSAKWKDSKFRHASNLHIGRGGKLGRRTVLLGGGPTGETNAEESVGKPDEMPILPRGLSSKQLRDLADLEHLRRQGKISESSYFGKRREILESATRN